MYNAYIWYNAYVWNKFKHIACSLTQQDIATLTFVISIAFEDTFLGRLTYSVI